MWVFWFAEICNKGNLVILKKKTIWVCWCAPVIQVLGKWAICLAEYQSVEFTERLSFEQSVWRVIEGGTWP